MVIYSIICKNRIASKRYKKSVLEFYKMTNDNLVNVIFHKIAYSVEETAEKTSLSKAFLRLEIKRGKLKVRRFGRRVLIRDEDLRDYIASGSDH